MQYDYVIIGSGFGGSVSALRLSEKGYKVLVIEKGKWFKKESDFPKSNWDLKRYFWEPKLGWGGLMKMTQLKHVGIFSGVGVGGGSLVYANTLPIPKDTFYTTGNWKGLANWKEELAPFYNLAYKMLGATKVKYKGNADRVWEKLAKKMGREDHYDRTKVNVLFGKKPGEKVKDPYFDGKGPDRKTCIYCANCIIGCKHDAKNSLDKNYLYLAQNLGCEIIAESKVYDVEPLSDDGSTGYQIYYKDSLKRFPKKHVVTTRGVIFSGGVLGTVELLLNLKHKNKLPNLSERLGDFIRTNSESLLTITNLDKKQEFTDGITIGSIIHTNDSTHIEPNNLGVGNGLWRIMTTPMAFGKNVFIRLFQCLVEFIKHPIDCFKLWFIDDFGKRTLVLLFMQTMDGTIQFKRGAFGGLKSVAKKGQKPLAFIPHAKEVAHHIESIIKGKAQQLTGQTLLGSASTAHILGGCCMGKDSNDGVIDQQNNVFGYKNMKVIDGSMMSANPGVNPSLSITAIAERAMTFVQNK